jgi:DNA-binding CsgD family transcriptional regulator
LISAAPPEYGRGELVGRDEELRQVTTLLEEARRGRSGTLVVVGDAGAGKTALLEKSRALASDMRVLAATGVESEAELPFASLHELLRPVLDLLPRIPPSQARALAAALALEGGEPDALAVGAGTLSLLVEVAEEVPALIVLDDAHWLDRASTEALAFAARRLIGESIAFLVALRPGLAAPFDPFPRLELGPLADIDARGLLSRRSEPVAAGDEARLLAAAAGNPLVLLELPVALTRELPGSATAGERLLRTFSRRIEELPAPTRLGLLLAASESDPGAVRRAAEHLELPEPLEAVEAAGLVRIEAGEVIFRHPVVRSLVYSNATAADRRAAHRALADALADDPDRDRRAWHLAAAVEGVDERVAAALEETADRAAARGGFAAQGQALERAARLSPERADRARRLHDAARAFRLAGDSGRALELAAEALPLVKNPLLHADLVHLVGSVRKQDAGISELDFLRELKVQGLDAERKAKLLTLAMDARLYALDAAGAVTLAPDAEAAAREAEWAYGLTYPASAWLLAGERERATELFLELAGVPDIPALCPWDYLWLEWYDELRASLSRSLRDSRAGGNRVRVAYALATSAQLEVRLGQLARAAAAAAEAIPLAEAIGTPAIAGIAAGGLALVHAWQGRADACRRLVAAALTAARGTGDSYQEGVARQALALLALGTARPADAIAELEAPARRWLASTVVEPGVVPFLPELVEAYALAGSTDEARDWLSRFSAIAEAADRTWAIAACARCEGLLADGEACDEPFTRALALHESSSLTLERARTQLAYGERLRRQGRRRDARTLLRLAHDAFAIAGASLWQARATSELRATGERVADDAEPLPDLTPQELHIALQVAEGKTNKEIAAALFLSTKTIEYHLANTYRKLDIHSRAELARIVTRDATTTGSVPASVDD